MTNNLFCILTLLILQQCPPLNTETPQEVVEKFRPIIDYYRTLFITNIPNEIISNATGNMIVMTEYRERQIEKNTEIIENWNLKYNDTTYQILKETKLLNSPEIRDCMEKQREEHIKMTDKMCTSQNICIRMINTYLILEEDKKITLINKTKTLFNDILKYVEMCRMWPEVDYCLASYFVDIMPKYYETLKHDTKEGKKELYLLIPEMVSMSLVCHKEVDLVCEEYFDCALSSFRKCLSNIKK